MIRRRKPEQASVAAQVQVAEHPAIAYLDGLFLEGDRIFFQLIHSTKKYTPINKKTGEPLLDSQGQPRLLAETKLLPLISVGQAATTEFINSLQSYETQGWNIYLCMNPFPEGTTTRTETLIQNVRNLYLDVDKTKVNGNHALQLIAEAVKTGLIPPPTSILESSPGNYHVVWCVDDFSWEEAKAMLPVLASKLGGDLAAIDLNRVLRLPGFKNLKKEREGFVCHLLEGVKDRLGEEPYAKAQFKFPIVVEAREKTEASPEAVQKMAEYINTNAAEAQFDLGAEDERSDGGVSWIIDCPWAAGHTTGQNTAMLMVLADGRPQFNCFHGHCNGVDGPKRGWSDIRKLWEEKVGHKQQFADVAEVYTNTTNPNPATAAKAATVEPPTNKEEVENAFVDAGDDSSPYDMTAEEIAAQQAAEYPVYKLREEAGPSFDENVMYGPVGLVAKKMAAYNESHIAAIYLNLLVSFGNILGRGPHFSVNKTEHYLNEYLACVGDSSTARKGTGGDEVNDFLSLISPEWAARRNLGGFSTPQGIIYQLRDDVRYQKLNKRKNTYEEVFKKGVDDKRLCIREGELSNVLKLMSDPKSRADELLRNMWDGKKLENLVAGVTDSGENKSLICTRPHGSIIGYTTGALMKSTMPVGSDVSGSGNRFIYAYIRRQKLVPSGGPTIDWGSEKMNYKGEEISLIVYFYETLKEGSQNRNIPLVPTARKYWENTYLKMERNQWDGFVGRMTNRAAAHVRRLATIFALMDRLPAVEVRHLDAALGIWEYSRASVRYIFVGYTAEQGKILDLAEKADVTTGIRSSDVHALFGRHKTGEWVRAQLRALVAGKWLVQDGEVYKRTTLKR